MQTAATPDTEPRASWSIPDWTRAVGIAVPTFYTLSKECQPDSVKIGRLRRITESPSAWTERVKKLGGAKTVRAAAERIAA
jgi:hypothetical protein